MSAELRLPLCAASVMTRREVAAALGGLGLSPPPELAALAAR